MLLKWTVPCKAWAAEEVSFTATLNEIVPHTKATGWCQNDLLIPLTSAPHSPPLSQSRESSDTMANSIRWNFCAVWPLTDIVSFHNQIHMLTHSSMCWSIYWRSQCRHYVSGSLESSTTLTHLISNTSKCIHSFLICSTASELCCQAETRGSHDPHFTFSPEKDS